MTNRLKIGDKFFGWTIVSSPTKVYKNRTNYFYLCLCICGVKRNVVEHALKSGKSKSCGCLKGKFVSNCVKKHGESGTRLYNIWRSMKQRCYYQKHMAFHNYGGRGISICKEWLSNKILFFVWARSHGYKDTLDIDRINNNGNYSPDNCRFVTKKENNNNRRDNLIK